MTDRLIRITTALAVATVAVAAVISYRHAYELVRSHGESGPTARLVPFTVDGLIWAASMLILDANRRNQPVPPISACPGGGRAATASDVLRRLLKDTLDLAAVDLEFLGHGALAAARGVPMSYCLLHAWRFG